MIALLLAEASSSDRWQPPGVKVGASRVLHMMHGATQDEEEQKQASAGPAAGSPAERKLVLRNRGRCHTLIELPLPN